MHEKTSMKNLQYMFVYRSEKEKKHIDKEKITKCRKQIDPKVVFWRKSKACPLSALTFILRSRAQVKDNEDS